MGDALPAAGALQKLGADDALQRDPGRNVQIVKLPRMGARSERVQETGRAGQGHSSASCNGRSVKGALDSGPVVRDAIALGTATRNTNRCGGGSGGFLKSDSYVE